MDNKRGQLTIFIIIAVIFIGAIILFFVFKEKIIIEEIPPALAPVYTSFLACLEEDVSTGIDFLGFQAGYIDVPEFEPGSLYMPFSNQLDFLGNPIPYWYYVSGNNIQKEQIPSKQEMEEQLAKFVEDKINLCRFDSYYDEGFEIMMGEPEATVSIEEENVKVSLNMNFEISKEEESAVVSNHDVIVNSKFGKLYGAAREIYNYEQQTLFLENYAVDTLRIYAPVDGVELSCSPKTWTADDIFGKLEEAIQSNTLALKVKGGSYSLKSKEDKYFIVDAPVDSELDVRFINSQNWPTVFDVSPSEGNILMASPVGNQPGLGIMGFCYVPYHFVYDLGYPVLIQLYYGDEIFQFPMAVVVKGNKPREALDVSAVDIELPELCRYKNTLIQVNTYDTRLNPIEADISYECFGTKCNIGRTYLTKPLEENFPQCVNGYIIASSEGFEDTKYLYSTVESGVADIILDNLYELEVNLKLDGKNYTGQAMINFVSDGSSRTVVYPEQNKINLTEGQYEIQTQIFRNSSLKIAETTKEQCVDVPQSGIGGIFGLTKEKCFDITIPEQIISNVLAGGGRENYYMLESELYNSNIIEINANSLPLPKTIEQLQDNYLLFEDNGLDINFK